MNGKSVTMIGINSAGITSKLESFNKLLCDVKPTIWFMQETKRNINQSDLKSNNLQNYHIFELKRQKTKEEGGKGWRGGGIAIGALPDVKPVLTRQGDDNCECLSVQIQTGPLSILCVVGYGPQSCDPLDRKQKFWNYLDQEVQYATENSIGIVIQIDSNAWAGDKIIPKDPNKQNFNGKLLEFFLERNSNIKVVNSLPLCSGLITRKRVTTHTNEKSVLDLFLVCERVLPYVTSMHVDEQGYHQLTNFYGISHNAKATESDHAMVELHMNIEHSIIKPVRNEFYNFNSPEGKLKFINLTNHTNKLSACFLNGSSYNIQFKKWQHTLRSLIIQSFPKIRTRKRKFTDTECGKLFEIRKKT